MDIQVNVSIDSDVLESLVIHMVEHFGYGSFNFKGCSYYKKSDLNDARNIYKHVIDGEASLLLTDSYEDDDKVYEINLKSLKQGLEKVAELYPHHYADIINDSCDVVTSDVLAQCIAFNEIVYG